MQLHPARHLVLLVCCLLLASPAALAGKVLRVLSWPGYADPDTVAAFEQQYDVRVELTEISTDEALWDKARADGGQRYDVLAANTAELQRMIAADLLVPIRLEAIPNTRLQLRRFRDLNRLPGVWHAGKVYGLPYAYAEMGLIYNRQLVKTPPNSMAALWDLQYRGKILLHEGSTHNFSLTALLAGEKNPFQLSENGFREVVRRLVALRANRPLLYRSPQDAVQVFKARPVALAFGNYGKQQRKALLDAGFDVGYVIPVEGALAWLDCWAVLRGGQQSPLALAWINFMLSREVSRLLTSRHGLANTVENPPDMGDEDQLFWLQPVENPERRAQFWARILSGYRKGMY